MPTYTLSGIEVEFPYDAYPCQLAYMAKVVTALQQGQHALLESPTGTGKTLCLLCATLAWRQSLVGQVAAQVQAVQQQPHSSTLVQGLREAWAEHRAAAAAEGGPASGLPQIVYSSRTHSQLQQVMRELKKLTTYRPRTATVASRQHSCLHPTVSTMQSGANQACRALVNKRACKWYNGVEKFMRQNPDVNAEVLDIEDLGRIGESRAVCPYFLARGMASTADIVFLPYNYLIDSKTRGGLGIQWQNAVLIFDEAHNVEQVCSDTMSFDLPAAALAGAIEELGIAAEIAANKGDAPVNIYNELGEQDCKPSFANLSADLHRGRAVLCRLEQEIAALAPNPDNGLTRPGAFLFELLGRCGINPTTWRILSGCLETATSILAEEAVEAGRRTGSRGSSYSLQTVEQMLQLAFKGSFDPALLDDPPPGVPPTRVGRLATIGAPGTGAGGSGSLPPHHACYKVHVHMQKNKAGRQAPTLSYWCFSPSLSMQDIKDMQVRSILLTSGTLSPLDSFAHELGLPFPVRLENGHVVGRDQVWCGVVPAGPSGQPLNSSYQNRENAAYRNDLGLALVNFCRIIPDGLLVFFPSYALLQSCIASWKQPPSLGGPSIWERIAKTKQPVVEPRESAAFNAAAEDFRNKLGNPVYNGAIFFAVTRGKASEGLDFSDAAGRAVVLTGIPYPMKMDPKVRLKQESLNEARSAPRKRPAAGPGSGNGGSGSGSGGAAPQGLSGDQWYTQSAMRAVNQAVGRVIRHRRDYGAIILCDERFRAPNVQRQLSCWLRDQVTVHPNYGAANASLVQFFKQQAEAARQGLVDGGQLTVPGAARPAPGSGLLASAAGGSKSAAGPFQGIGGGSGGRSLLQSVPTAIDAVGMTDLFAPMAAAAAAAAPDPTAQQQQQQGPQQQQQPGSQEAGAGGSGAAGGASRLVSAIARGGGGGSGAPARQVSGQTAAAAAAVNSLLSELGAAGSQQRASGAGGSGGSKQFEPRPWERAALAASARPCPPRAPAPPVVGGGGNTAGNIVGPAHLVAQHADRQRSRSSSAEPEAEQAQQAQQGEAGGPAAMETDQQAQQAQQAERAQHGAQPPAEQEQQQAAAAGKAGGSSSCREQTVAAYLGELKAALSKEQFTAMRAELQAYSKGKDLARLLAAALPLLQLYPALLEGFATFVPKSARPQLQQAIQQMRGRAGGAAAASRGAAAGGAAATATRPQTHLAGMPRQQQQQQQQQQHGASVRGTAQALQPQLRQSYGQQPASTAAGAAAAGARQPLGQNPQLRPGQQGQQAQHAQRQQQKQQPKSKLQQMLAGAPLRPNPAVGGAGAAVRPALPGNLQQQQRGGGGAAPVAAMLPPRGMHQAMAQARPGPAGALRPGGMAAPPAVPPLQRAAAAGGSRAKPRGGGSGGQPRAAGPPCAVCSKAPMESPHQSGCGHSACYGCWLKALATFKPCPVCAKPVRKTQLTKLHFV